MADDKVSLCRLWKKTGNYGDYFVGRMGGARVLVYQNLRKADDSDHDAEIFVVNATDTGSQPRQPKQASAAKPRAKSGPRGNASAQRFQAPMHAPGPKDGEPIIDDDLDAVFGRLVQDHDGG